MSNVPNLPLFPLMTVLFPGQILHLHIFEKRYHRLVRDVMAQDGVFGVAMIKHGQEAGEPAEPYLVGVTSKIHTIERLEDGSLELVCSGKKRFQIQSLANSRPYLACDAELWPWSYNPARDDRLAGELKLQLNKYLLLLSHILGNTLPIPETLPEDTFNLACLTGISTKITELEKQELLSTVTLTDFSRASLRLLKREILMLKRNEAVPSSLVSQSIFLPPN